jgi:uncharacterized protein (DUF305 family)
MTLRTTLVAALIALVSLGGSRALAAQTAPRHTAADARFMQEMIGHHAQAVEMATLVEARTTSSAIRLLAERISVSQTDEIVWMKEWLTDRGEPLPDPHAHHGAAHASMPGMLTDAQMAELRAAREADFDRLFVTFMIQHHEGALVMVAQLLGTPRAAQEAATAYFVAEVDSDQRMEIARMRMMLSKTPDPH